LVRRCDLRRPEIRLKELDMIRLAASTIAVALLLGLPQAALAQAPSPPPAQPAGGQVLSQGQVDALVAPIALYPDALISEILMASTYPLEVVEAERWLKANKNLKGDGLESAVSQQSWDNSIKSLIATPDVLDMMSAQLDWTQQLGDAVLAQQPDVMAAIQRLRAKAQSNNKLASNPQQTVTTQVQDGVQDILITPTEPDNYYIPYYDPSVMFGPWDYPDYPPDYWGAPDFIAAGILAVGIGYGAHYALRRWIHGGYWHGGVNWRGRSIVAGGNNWAHDPLHRHGVRYSNSNVAARFTANRAAITAGAPGRMEFRGRGPLPGGVGAAISHPAIAAKPAARGAIVRPANGAFRGPGNALGNISSGHAIHVEAARGRASLGGGAHVGGGGGGFARPAGGGGGFARPSGGGGGGGSHPAGGGGARRSDMRLKHDIARIGTLDNGIGLYRFVYNGEITAYVGVMAQEVEALRPDAVTRGRDGYLRVDYGKLGLKFQSYHQWIASGAALPSTALSVR
jgi:hypothetical protein